MPTTPNRGLHYPASNTPPDIPGDIYNLATDLDNLFSTWKTYTANASGMPPGTQINGTFRYVNGDIEFQVNLTATGTGGTGQLGFSLPTNIGSNIRAGQVSINRPGVRSYPGTMILAGSGTTNVVLVNVIDASGAIAAFTAANNGTPIAWQNTDNVYASGMYTPI